LCHRDGVRIMRCASDVAHLMNLVMVMSVALICLGSGWIGVLSRYSVSPTIATKERNSE
jgi:hypothetical protein